jgi:hypothetical protein
MIPVVDHDGMTTQRWRTTVALVWCVVAVLLWLAVLTACALALAFLGHLLGEAYEGMFAFVGACGGLLLGVTVCQRASGWVQRYRMRRLRRRGTSAVARVERLDLRQTSGRGATSRYTVRVRWDGFSGARTYRFDGHGKPEFAALTATGSTVTVRYPPGRPRRFVIDVPYAAGMVDQFT